MSSRPPTGLSRLVDIMHGSISLSLAMHLLAQKKEARSEMTISGTISGLEAPAVKAKIR